ncbi:MAG: HAD hydrolase-like protein [Phycisphaeraceae bacterium]|nr:HAD hydrolase-like protein [Phycisphaeraceae bacterium]
MAIVSPGVLRWGVMLVLFDIDATLISTSGVGMRCMVEAGRGLFGPGFHADGVAFAGRLDPLIIDDLLRVNGVPGGAREREAMRLAYTDRLMQALRVPGVGRALPGVPSLLAGVERTDGMTMGLLTGNFESTGRLKLSACGIDDSRFKLCVWGDESPEDPPSREQLPGVALERYAAATGRRIDPTLAVIIGDTPHDVSCARAHGLRVIGVATGSYSTADLAGAGADRVVSDLSETARVLGWLTAWMQGSRDDFASAERLR